MAYHHPGVIVKDRTENGPDHPLRMMGRADLGTMHKIRNPELVDMVHFIGLPPIGPILWRKPLLFLEHPE